MEVNQRLLRDLCLNISPCLHFLHLLHCGIVRIDVCPVVLVVVQLHYLAGDGWFEGTIVIYREDDLLAILVSLLFHTI